MAPSRSTISHGIMAAEPKPIAAPESAIRLRGLTKTYRGRNKQPDKLALHPIDLDIPAGSIFGLLGPNGAGKSTMINILAGLVTKTAGDAWIWGYDIARTPRQARASIGVVPQELNIDPFFTPRELLDLQAGLYGVRSGSGSPPRSWTRWVWPTRPTATPAPCPAACGGG